MKPFDDRTENDDAEPVGESDSEARKSDEIQPPKKAETKKAGFDRPPKPKSEPKSAGPGDGLMTLSEYMTAAMPRNAGHYVSVGFRTRCHKLGLAGSRLSVEEWNSRYEKYLKSG